MVSAAAAPGDGGDDGGPLGAAALRLPRCCQLWHPANQRSRNFRGGSGQREGVPVGGLPAELPPHPPGFRQHPQKDAVAIVGIARMNATVVSHEEYPVNTIIVHEGFDNRTMANNLALLKTDAAMQFTGLVQPICFLGGKLYMPLASRNCWVAGWNPTFATGKQMTMSILRKISVQDINLCPVNEFQKTGCGSHVEQETDTVCLGDPGNPLMCQLQGLDLWVLRGILTQGGEKCPGLFLYVKVEDYSDWITSETQTDSLLPLSMFHHYHHHQENAAPAEGPSAPTMEAQLQEPANMTLFMARSPWPENSSLEGAGPRGKGVRDSGSSPGEGRGRRRRPSPRTMTITVSRRPGTGRPFRVRTGCISPKKRSCFALRLFSFGTLESLGANPPPTEE
ncbi:inactive serine protease 54 [Eptesicus fuscus]|uniref:inactive serine protease 54 n=1 Tax=Eptesicus fuscus TaxID=29078 RepID=UPI0024047C3B|nr:inactive serine protease 54 [Eptesicus fuscus]